MSLRRDTEERGRERAILKSENKLKERIGIQTLLFSKNSRAESDNSRANHVAGPGLLHKLSQQPYEVGIIVHYTD